MDDRPVVLTVGFALSEVDETWRDFRHVAAPSQAQAVAEMFSLAPAVVLIDLDLAQGSPIAVADFTSYRHPDARVIFISDSDMFSDGSLFAHCGNVHAHVGRGMAEPDMVALVAHHARPEGSTE
jgi:DNA-binding NarL/FixJ family response regulator